MKQKLRIVTTAATRYSNSVRAVAQALTNHLGYKVFRSTQPRQNRKLLMYGGGRDKLQQYQWFHQQGIPAVLFTTDIEQAKQWCSEGQTVFGRTLLRSSCGKGIKVFTSVDEVTPCPVYTLYKKKKREFRVHIFKDQVVTVLEKKRKKEFEGVRDTKIRNIANGYVFVQNLQDFPEQVKTLALQAASVVQSDFKGVDIGYNEKNNEVFVIEVNSAPGITGNNVGKYVQTILEKV